MLKTVCFLNKGGNTVKASFEKKDAFLCDLGGKKLDFKDSLFMGKTAFEMRGNLGNKEPKIQQKWKEMDLYQKRIRKNEGKRDYTLHDGPPYANGNIHLGHALNKILKDFVVRYKNMNGYRSVYIPGWDTHGLPI